MIELSIDSVTRLKLLQSISSMSQTLSKSMNKHTQYFSPYVFWMRFLSNYCMFYCFKFYFRICEFSQTPKQPLEIINNWYMVQEKMSSHTSNRSKNMPKIVENSWFSPMLVRYVYDINCRGYSMVFMHLGLNF